MGQNPTQPQDPHQPGGAGGGGPVGPPADPEGTPDPRWRVALAVAVAVVVIVLAAWWLTRPNEEPTSAASPTPSPSATPSPTVTVTETATPTPSDGDAGPCQADALDPSVAADGGAAGTVYYALLLRNAGPASCTVDGHPTLSGVTSDGTEEKLPLETTIDGSQAQQYPVGAPGPVAPGADAGIIISKTSDPGNCPAGGSTYDTLRIDLGEGQVISMPYPAELAPAACLRGQSDIGPVTSP